MNFFLKITFFVSALFSSVLVLGQPVISDFGNKSNALFLGQKKAFGGCFAGNPDVFTISGSGFLIGTTVSVNGIAAPSTVISTSLIEAQMPYYAGTLPGKNLSGPIYVSNISGSDISAVDLEAIFCIDFQFNTPTLAPGTVLRIDGGDLDKITAISIAGQNVSFNYNNVESKLFIKIPSTLPGTPFDIVFAQGSYVQIPTFPFSFSRVFPPNINFITSSAGIGQSVVIQGSNFGSNSSQNAIKVGSVSVPPHHSLFSSNVLGFTMPTYSSGGAAEVTNLLTGLSKKIDPGVVREVPIYSIPTLAGGSFHVVTHSGHTELYGMVATDIDLDGKTDIIGLEKGTANVVAYLNQTPESTSVPGFSRIVLGTVPSAFTQGGDVKITDVNEDGMLDVSISNFLADMYILQNLSTASGTVLFKSPLVYTLAGPNTAVQPTELVWGDFDADGKKDVFTSIRDGSTHYTTVLRNQSEVWRITTQSLESNVILNTLTGGLKGQSILADLDGDGRQEWIVSDNSTNASIFVYSFVGLPGYITTSLMVPVYFYTAPTSVGDRFFSNIQSIDLTNDGKPELVLTDDVDNQVWIFTNASVGAGSVSFSAPFHLSLPSAGTPVLLRFGNLSGELSGTQPQQDLVVLATVSGGLQLSMFQNRHNVGNSFTGASFAPPYTVTIPGSVSDVWGLEVADFNMDGLMDVVLHGSDSHFTFFLNAACPAYVLNWPAYGAVVYDQSLGGTLQLETSLPGLNMHYQWYYNLDGTISALSDGSVFSGTNSSVLSITGVPVSLSGAVLFVVATPLMGNCLPFTSPGIATLQVIPCYSVGITLQPNSVLGCIVGTSTFSVVATGTGLTFQWQEYDGVQWSNLFNIGPYNGVNTTVLGISNPSGILSGRQYRVLVSGICSSTSTSIGVHLILNQGISIVTEPLVPEPVCVNTDSLVFTVSAVGYNLQYAWQRFDGTIWQNFTNSGQFKGVDTPRLVILQPTADMEDMQVRVVVSDNCSHVAISEPVENINLLYAPSIISQPTSPFGVCLNTGTLVFDVITSGNVLGYQWQINQGNGWQNLTLGPNFSNVNSENLSVNNPPYSLNGARVRLSISGACLHVPLLSDSSAYIVVFNTTPDIVFHPISDTLCANEESTIMVVSVVGTDITYTWEMFEDATWKVLPNNSYFSDTNKDTLRITRPGIDMHDKPIRVRIKGSCSSMESTTNGQARLHIYDKPTPIQIVTRSCIADSNRLVVPNNPFYQHYQWTLDGSPIVGDTLPVYYLLADGNYYVFVNGVRSCASQPVYFQLPVGTRNPSIVSQADTMLVAPEALEYTWYVNDRVLSGENSRTLKIFYNGTYKVDLVYPDGCFAITAPYVVSKNEYPDAARYMEQLPDGSVQLLRPKHRFFPNPTSDMLFITANVEINYVEIFTPDGFYKGVIPAVPQGNGIVSVGLKSLGLAPGIYFIKIGTQWQKILLQ